MVITLSEKLKKEVLGVVRELGYKSEKHFVENALLRRFSELKKAGFLSKATKIKKALQKKGLTEDDILKDFDRFRRSYI